MVGTRINSGLQALMAFNNGIIVFSQFRFCMVCDRVWVGEWNWNEVCDGIRHGVWDGGDGNGDGYGIRDYVWYGNGDWNLV